MPRENPSLEELRILAAFQQLRRAYEEIDVTEPEEEAAKQRFQEERESLMEHIEFEAKTLGVSLTMQARLQLHVVVLRALLRKGLRGKSPSDATEAAFRFVHRLVAIMQEKQTESIETSTVREARKRCGIIFFCK